MLNLRFNSKMYSYIYITTVILYKDNSHADCFELFYELSA